MARPKQRIAVDREARSPKRVITTLPNGSTERDSSGTSSDDSPSIELAGHPESSWVEGALQMGEDEALSRETLPPDPLEDEEEDCVILKSVAASELERLATTKDTLSGCHEGRIESSVAARSFDCTACGKKFFSTSDIVEHPHLRVGFCRKCRNFLFSSPYTKSPDDGSEEQCRWCGEGGKIVMCDDCDKVFCEDCIIRNFGPKSLVEIVNGENWTCFSCKPEHLRAHIHEFQEFKKSTRSAHPDRFTVTRRASSVAKSRTIKYNNTRDATNLSRLGDDGGATIADLLAREAERRRQNSVHSDQKPSRTVKEQPGSRNRAGASISKQTDRTMESNATIADIVRRGPGPSSTSHPAPTYIRPHQWAQKRQHAVERRKRAEEAAEADRWRNNANLPNDGTVKNEGINYNAHAVADSRVRHSHSNEIKLASPLRVHRGEDHAGTLHNDHNGMTQVIKSEHLPDDSDSLLRAGK